MKRYIAQALAFCLAIGAAQAEAQGFKQRMEDSLAQPFVGVTTDGTPEADLFSLQSTGPSTQPIADAALALIAGLSEAQREQLLFPVADEQWRRWINIHLFPREGAALKDMNDEQRRLVYDLLKASLSAKGYKTSRDIMRLNAHLAELISNFEDYGEFRYWIAIMGEPSSTQPWGWQLEGHHLIINFFVLGDQIVMTPTFMGSEPVTAESGKYAGVSVLQDKQDAGHAFMLSLDAGQQDVARIGEKQGQGENETEAYKDNATLPFEGLNAADMTAAQRDALLELIALYVGDIRDGHSEIKMEEVRTQLDRTYFAWKGDTTEGAVFYYRIHSPVILIEFDHAGTIALDGPRGEPRRRHIHTVVRTPNGNDYGADLLRRHYEMHGGEPGHMHSH